MTKFPRLSVYRFKAILPAPVLVRGVVWLASEGANRGVFRRWSGQHGQPVDDRTDAEASSDAKNDDDGDDRLCTVVVRHPFDGICEPGH